LDSKLPKLASACEQVGRDPAQVQVTVLDLPVIGRDREDTSALVERLRGRTSAAAFARAHHAGTAVDHIGRYRQLAERGVSTVFVSLPDLAGPEEVLKLAPVAAAFAGGQPFSPKVRHFPRGQAVNGSSRWLTAQGACLMPEQVLLSMAPGQPPLSRWSAQIDTKSMCFERANFMMALASAGLVISVLPG